MSTGIENSIAFKGDFVNPGLSLHANLDLLFDTLLQVQLPYKG